MRNHDGAVKAVRANGALQVVGRTDADVVVPSDRRRYCVIAGAPRCGTTSLFDYLSAHPDVTPSYVKQTGFFLDPDYDGVAVRPSRSHVNPDDNYDGFFESERSGGLRLESTPDYLFSEGTVDALHRTLRDDVTLIFILRNPVEQFVSLAHHLARVGMVPADASPEDLAIDALSADGDARRLLLHRGEYARFLEPYVERFGASSVRLLFTEEMAADPRRILSELAARLELDPGFYSDFRFEESNVAVATRSRTVQGVYRVVRQTGLRIMAGNSLARTVLLPIRAFASASYRRLNARPVDRVAVTGGLSVATHGRLVEHFRPWCERLEALAGRPLPWVEFTPAKTA